MFRYVEEPATETAELLGEPPALRPVVAVRLTDHHPAPRVAALVDSGSERTYAAPALGRSIGVDLRDATEVSVRIGGGQQRVRFATVQLALFRDLLDDDDPTPLAEWEATVGFFNKWEPPWSIVLGQRGFFDHFTVTMQRAVPALVVDSYDAFDEQFGVLIDEADNRQPRFRA